MANWRCLMSQKRITPDEVGGKRWELQALFLSVILGFSWRGHVTQRRWPPIRHGASPIIPRIIFSGPIRHVHMICCAPSFISRECFQRYPLYFQVKGSGSRGRGSDKFECQSTRPIHCQHYFSKMSFTFHLYLHYHQTHHASASNLGGVLCF
jgi:hypothetical protein